MYAKDSTKEFTIRIGKTKTGSMAFKAGMLESVFFDYKKKSIAIPLTPLALLGVAGVGAVSSGVLSPLLATALVGGSLFAYTSAKNDFRKHQIVNVLAYTLGHSSWSDSQWASLYQSFKDTVSQHDISALQSIAMGRFLFSTLGELNGMHPPIRVVLAVKRAFERVGIPMAPIDLAEFQSPKPEHDASDATSTFSP